MTNWSQKALEYAEKYGIVKYQVKNDIMIYRERFPSEGTYKVYVDLATLKEKRIKL